MSRLLLRQGCYVPLAAMLVPVAMSWFVPDYSSVSQHMSELELLGGAAAAITRVAAIVSGLSIVLFAAGLLGQSRRYAFTATVSFVFGLSMMSNGIFVMGSPLHGLYGVGIFAVLGPAFFVAEAQDAGPGPRARTWLLAAAFLTLLYMWLMFAGLDPSPYRGLTQRLAVVVMFGWYSLAGFALLRGLPRAERRAPDSEAFQDPRARLASATPHS